jgi:type IV secretion system protein VirD4
MMVASPGLTGDPRTGPGTPRTDTYSRPGVTAAVEAGGFTPSDLFERSGTLCIVTPNAEGDRSAPYFTTMASAILHEAETRAARRAGAGGPALEPRLLLALDEVGNVFRHPASRTC